MDYAGNRHSTNHLDSSLFTSLCLSPIRKTPKDCETLKVYTRKTWDVPSAPCRRISYQSVLQITHSPELQPGSQSSTEPSPGCSLQARAPLSIQLHQPLHMAYNNSAIGPYLHIIIGQLPVAMYLMGTWMVIQRSSIAAVNASSCRMPHSSAYS